MSDQRIFTAPSRAELQEKLDAIYATGKPFKDIPLPADGYSSRSSYRDFTIRYWRDPQTGVDRYDTAVDFG